MTNDFANWLAQNGLVEAFTTTAGDALFVNLQKRFGVLKKCNDYGAQSFYLDDIFSIQTKDDEHLVAEWNRMTGWRTGERSTRYSTNEVYIIIRFANQTQVKLQVFHGTKGNISRDTYDHANLYNYACQLTQILYSFATGAGNQ